MKYVTQMLGLTVQNFVSAGTGIAVLIALIRGFSRRNTDRLGNFWADLTRVTLYVLLPLSFVLAIALVSQGVVQTLDSSQEAQLLQPYVNAEGQTVSTQTIAAGPVASQVAIKQLGTNGGGFFNANSAHPFENPTPLTGFMELVSILLIPAALCFTFGRMVGNTRQGWVVLAAMMIIFLGMVAAAYYFEQQGVPQVAQLGADLDPAGGTLAGQPGGNMEGKEVRFGIAGSAAWASATTSASNGSVNSMHDSFTPLGGLVPLVMIQLGEVVFGGVGSGLYVMLVFAIVAVFIAGLMVGRTPEYLGKKIETYEMKMASLVILIPVITILLGTLVGIATEAGRAGISNPGAHGLTQVLYAFTSAAGNNGSAFAGLSVQQHVLQRGPGDLHADRTVLDTSAHACPGWIARRETARPRERGHAAHGRADVHGPAHCRRHRDRCFELPAGPGPWAHRRTPHDGRVERREIRWLRTPTR